MARSHVGVDSVRASRDGHEFHEAWVARKSLGLLLPQDGFVGVAIEGFSPGDKVSQEATEIADAVLYYGRAANFLGADRVVVVQVKYSKASEFKPFRAADAKHTIEKFARTYRAHKRDHGVGPARSRLRFELVTNRPILSELEQAIVALRDGTTLKGVAKTQAKQLCDAIKLRGKDLAEFAARLRVTGIAGDLRQSKHELAIALADWSVARDLQARLRLNNLRDLARTKAGLIGQHRNVIMRADVLTALDLQHEDELLPVRESFPEVGSVVERDQLASVAAHVPKLARPLVIHADGGVGKTVFMQSLAAKLGDFHDVVLFDCFGMGQYRATADARHLPQRGLIHIVNLLACRGLCDPLLPSSSSDSELIRSFRSRLTQATETLRAAMPDRQLVLLLDAIDNAGEHALARGETSFPRLLLEDLSILGPIPGLQVVVSARGYRLKEAIGAASCDELLLQPFTLDESRAFLRDRVDGLTEGMLQVAQSRSRGNARILDHLADEDPELLAPSEINNVIQLDDLLRSKIAKALAEARQQGYREEEIASFLAGLATLPPPVPVREFAEANGLVEGAVNSFAADLSPLLEQTKYGLMIRDEPTERLIRETYAANETTLRNLARNLLAMQDRSVYAATTLPDLLQQLGDGDQLFDLAFDERIPPAITSAAGKQAIRQARIRAAVAFAANHEDSGRLVQLLVELSTLAAMNQRGTQYLLDNPDLAVAAAEADSLRRLFEARTDWPGARHARLTIAHVLAGELPDATRHAHRVAEWRRHYYDQEREDRTRDEGPTALDMASIPLSWLARDDGKAAAHDLAGWRDWYGFQVAERLFALVQAGAPTRRVSQAAMETMFASDAMKSGVLAAAIAHVDGDEPLQRELITRLAGICEKADLGESDYQPKEHPIVRGMLRAAAVAVVLGMASEALAILDATKIPVPSLYIFLDEYWTRDAYPFVASQVLRGLAAGTPIDQRMLLPLELSVAAAGLAPTLQGTEFRTTLKEAMREASKEETPASDSDRRVSRDDVQRAERFIDSRLSTWETLARAFALAMTRSPSGGDGRLRPLIAEWNRLRVSNDYYTGGLAAQRQFNVVGERLLTLAVSADPAHEAQEVRDYVDAVSAAGVTPVSNVIELVGILSRRLACEMLAGKAAVRAREAIERLDDVSERASSFAQIARAIAPASPDDAAEYFRRGLEQVDAVGSGDWEFVSELMHFAGTLHGGRPDDSDSHTLSNICDLNLGEEYKFDWAGYGRALAHAAGPKGLARLARWEDRDRISLNYTLLPYLKALLDNGDLEPSLALIMLRVSSPAELRICGTAEFVEALVRHPSAVPASLATELIHHYQQNNPGGYGSDNVLALSRLAAQALGEDSAEQLQLLRAGEAIAEATREFNSLNNWRSPTPQADHAERDAEEAKQVAEVRARVAALHPLDDAAVAEALVALDSLQGRRLEREFLEALRVTVPLAGMPKFIEMIARLEQLDLYDKFHELNECKAAWSGASDAVGNIWPRCAAWIVHANPAEFVSFGQLSGFHLTRVSELTGLDRHTLVEALLKEFSRPGVEVPASVWLSVAASFNTKAAPGAGQAALARLLQGGAAKLAPLVADGEWNSGLYPEDDAVEVTAGLVWFGLGAPRAERRWMSAHALRSAVRLGRSDVLDRVVARFGDKTAGAFGAPELPFFYLHAQLWLLIAMARVALESPRAVAPHREFLERVALDQADPHVLRQHFAMEALLACHRGGVLKLSKAALAQLRRINRSGYPLAKRSGGGASFYESRPDHIPAPNVEVGLEYDFDKSEVSEVATLFDRERWVTRDAISAWVHQHAPTVTSMYDLGGRLDSRRSSHGEMSETQHHYGEHLCWHALYGVAAQFLRDHPVATSPYNQRQPWQEWLREQTLTQDDGRWLADGTDWRQASTRVNLREVTSDGVALTADPVKLCALLGVDGQVGEWLVVDGDWSSVDGIDVHVRSAMAPSEQSDAVAKGLAAEDPFHANAPRIEDYQEGEPHWLQFQLPFRPWLVHVNARAGIDRTDIFGAIGAAERSRLTTDAILFGGLTMKDPFGREWIDASDATVLRVEAWCQFAGRDEGERSTGAQAICRSNFIHRLLAAQNCDLICLVRLRRTESGRGTRKTQFWHTTFVVRVTPSLGTFLYPGRANELRESRY